VQIWSNVETETTSSSGSGGKNPLTGCALKARSNGEWREGGTRKGSQEPTFLTMVDVLRSTIDSSWKHPKVHTFTTNII
jgi:hypothetical protein